MKHRIAVLLLSVLVVTNASEPIVSSRPGPQSRLRLKQSAQGVSSQIEPVKVPSSQQTPVSMEKVVVTDSKLPSAPKAEANDPVHFSPLRGGPIFKGKIGELPISVGLWPWREILTDDIPFQHQKTRADFDVVRIKL